VIKPSPENCKNCSSTCAYDCAQLLYTVQHRLDLLNALATKMKSSRAGSPSCVRCSAIDVDPAQLCLLQWASTPVGCRPPWRCISTSSLVFPEVDFRKCVYEGGCVGISPAAYEKRVQNMLVSVSEAALIQRRTVPIISPLASRSHHSSDVVYWMRRRSPKAGYLDAIQKLRVTQKSKVFNCIHSHSK